MDSNPTVIVFDLDNTLFDTRSIPAALTAGLFDSVRAANTGPDAVPSDVLSAALDESWSVAFTLVAKKYRLPQRISDVWSEFHNTLTFPEPLIPFDDVVETLHRLRDEQRFVVLLTSGYERVQRAKVDALGLTALFDLIVVDAVDVEHRGKQPILADLISSRHWLSQHMLIVGDSAISEIAAGNALGIPTVQILRPGVVRTDTATRHICSLREL
jgi:phosphoglycolate phosphatase-like HAD superfamily hydrolase